MRWSSRFAAGMALLVALWAVLGGRASGGDKDSPGKSSTGRKSAIGVDEILSRWEQKTRSASTVEVWFSLLRRRLTWNDEMRFEGSAKLARAGKACVQLEFVPPPPLDQAAGGRSLAEMTISTGERVYLYDYSTRQVFIYPQTTQGQEPSWEDAARFLYNVTANDIRERYRVELVKVTPKAYLIQAFPRDNGSSSFSRAELVLDRESFSPSYLRLIEINGKDSQTYQFKKILRDGPISPAVFEGKLMKGWTVVDFTAPAATSRPPGRPLPPPILSQPARGR